MNIDLSKLLTFKDEIAQSQDLDALKPDILEAFNQMLTHIYSLQNEKLMISQQLVSEKDKSIYFLRKINDISIKNDEARNDEAADKERRKCVVIGNLNEIKETLPKDGGLMLKLFQTYWIRLTLKLILLKFIAWAAEVINLVS